MGAAVQDGLTTDVEMNAISRYLMDTFRDAKELGSIITVEPKDYDGYVAYLDGCDGQGQLTMDDADWLQNTRPMLKTLARQAKVLSAKYPVVCTNPPYLNKIEGRLKTFVTENYKDYSGDLFSVFTYRNLMFCKQDGYCGYMTPFVWMFIKTYEKLREFIIRNKSIATLVQMEYSAFEEATVPICSFVLKNGKATENGLYFKLSDFKGGMEVQKQKVLEALANKNCGYFYETDQSNFSKIPGSPVAYWASEQYFRVLSGTTASDLARFCKGMDTGDNNRFLRLWHEIRFDKMWHPHKWVPYNKGGSFRRWYGDNEYVINWADNGQEVKSFKGSNIRNQITYLRPGMTWSTTSSGPISIRWCFGDYVYDSKGCMAFANNEDDNWYILGAANTKAYQSFMQIITPTIDYNPGPVSRGAIIYKEEHSDIDELVKKNITMSKYDWDSYETSWDFKRNPLV